MDTVLIGAGIMLAGIFVGFIMALLAIKVNEEM